MEKTKRAKPPEEEPSATQSAINWTAVAFTGGGVILTLIVVIASAVFFYGRLDERVKSVQNDIRDNIKRPLETVGGNVIKLVETTAKLDQRTPVDLRDRLTSIKSELGNIAQTVRRLEAVLPTLSKAEFVNELDRVNKEFKQSQQSIESLQQTLARRERLDGRTSEVLNVVVKHQDAAGKIVAALGSYFKYFGEIPSSRRQEIQDQLNQLQEELSKMRDAHIQLIKLSPEQ